MKGMEKTRTMEVLRRVRTGEKVKRVGKSHGCVGGCRQDE